MAKEVKEKHDEKIVEREFLLFNISTSVFSVTSVANRK
jgi:hypothetical protein